MNLLKLLNQNQGTTGALQGLYPKLMWSFFSPKGRQYLLGSTWTVITDPLGEAKPTRKYLSDDLTKCPPLFLGFSNEGACVVPLEAITKHIWVRGAPGSGKSSGITGIAHQLLHHGLPLIYLDYKGERAIEAELFLTGEKLGRTVKKVTFINGEPTHGIRNILDSNNMPFERAAHTADILGIYHGEGYGMTFYSDVGKSLLEKAYKKHPEIETFEDLDRAVTGLIEGLPRGERKDAMGLCVAIQNLASIPQINISERNSPPDVYEHAVDFRDALEKNQVILIVVPAAKVGAAASAIGRAIVAAARTASFDLYQARKRPTLSALFIDEAQHAVKTPTVEWSLEQMRYTGLGFVLAHQHDGQLGDYSDSLRNAQIRIHYSVEMGSLTHDEILKLGEKKKIRVTQSGGTSRNRFRSVTSGESYSAGGTRLQEGSAIGGGVAEQDGWSQQEMEAPYIETNDIVALNADPKLALCHIQTGVKESGIDGFPFFLRFNHHISAKDFFARASFTAPAKPGVFTAGMTPKVEVSKPSSLEHSRAAYWQAEMKQIHDAL